MTAGFPKHVRLRVYLLRQIADRTWPAGALVPSEVELCRQFEISRTTVRKAVGDLASQGKLVVVHGKGTFVASPKLDQHFVQRAFGIHEEMQHRGIPLSTRVLRQDVIAASTEVAAGLRISHGEPVHMIVRLRLVEQEPLLVSTTHIPYALCPDLDTQDLGDRSLYGLLRDHYDLAIDHGQRRIEAIAAGPREARILDIALASPLLLLESIAYTNADKPFEHSIALQRGDRAAVEVAFEAAPYESGKWHSSDLAALDESGRSAADWSAAELLRDALAGAS